MYDEGFDVYLPCRRGTLYSDTHDTYTKYDKEFWDFSSITDEYKDIAAAIDVVY